ncbi:hypothetical protein GCM10009837_83800 [Streptomyces durmitorensis]
MQCEPALEAGEEVLAARGDVQDGAPGEVDGRELRDAEVGARDGVPGERGVQPPGCLVDGVSFGHEVQGGMSGAR